MAISEDISDLFKNPTSILERYKSLETKVLGYTCSYIPEELIISAGLQPYRIPNVGAKPSALTPSFICPFSSAVLENAIKHEDFFSGFVVAHTCDPMWRLYDILKKKTSKPVFLLRVPHNTEDDLSLEFFEKELCRFKEFLEENFNTKIDGTELLKAIRLCNENRSLLKGIFMQNSEGKYVGDALERFQLTIASMWMPKAYVNVKIKEWKLNNEKSVSISKVRLHLNGTAIYDLNLIGAVEEAGGFIASDDLCTGSRYFWDNVEEKGEPLLALAHRYLKKAPCPPQSPIESRLEYTKFMVKKFKAQGVVTFTERFCDPTLYDSVHLKDMLTKEGIPTTLIDYENPSQELGRIKTRIEAFIESLGG